MNFAPSERDALFTSPIKIKFRAHMYPLNIYLFILPPSTTTFVPSTLSFGKRWLSPCLPRASRVEQLARHDTKRKSPTLAASALKRIETLWRWDLGSSATPLERARVVSSIQSCSSDNTLTLRSTLPSGRVRLAKHKRHGSIAAIKIISKATFQGSRMSLATLAGPEDKALMNIQREMVIMKLIHHPNIMSMYDVYETDTNL